MHEREQDREMILNPSKWPLLVLPLKRRNPFHEGNMAIFVLPLGLTTYPPDKPIEIRIGMMFGKPLSELPTKQYANVDALLDDDWQVD